MPIPKVSSSLIGFALLNGAFFEDVCLLLDVFLLIKVDFMNFRVLLNILLIVVILEEFLEDLLFGAEVEVGKDECGDEYFNFDKIEEGDNPEGKHLK